MSCTLQEPSFQTYLLLTIHKGLQVVDNGRFEVFDTLPFKGSYLLPDVSGYCLKVLLTFVNLLLPLWKEQKQQRSEEQRDTLCDASAAT